MRVYCPLICFLVIFLLLLVNSNGKHSFRVLSILHFRSLVYQCRHASAFKFPKHSSRGQAHKLQTECCLLLQNLARENAPLRQCFWIWSRMWRQPSLAEKAELVQLPVTQLSQRGRRTWRQSSNATSVDYPINQLPLTKYHLSHASFQQHPFLIAHSIYPKMVIKSPSCLILESSSWFGTRCPHLGLYSLSQNIIKALCCEFSSHMLKMIRM